MESVKGGPGKGRDVAVGDSILVVSRKTGFGMETLRAWERRHGFPQPQRRPGSNRRVYSESDIERLLAMKHAMARGFRVGDVIDKTLGELAALGASVDAGSPRGDGRIATIDELIATLARDAISELDDALRVGAALLGPRRFVTELAHPLAVAVGVAWAEGRLAVRHEHLATESLITRIRQLLASQQDSDGSPLVLLATLPGETHTLGLQLVALYLTVKTSKARLLGASTPPDEIDRAARSLGASVVGLTVTAACDKRETRKAVRALRRKLPEGTALWLGGQGASGLGLDEPGIEMVASWEGIDAALARARAVTAGPAAR